MAFHALKDLAEGLEESDLLRDAKTKDGRIMSAEIPWMGGSEAARKKVDGQVLLGKINISNRKMVVEVNSVNRAQKILRHIVDRLGARATYMRTLIEPIESQLAAAAAAGATPAAKSGNVESDWVDDQMSGDSNWDALLRGSFGPHPAKEGRESVLLSPSEAPPEVREAMEEMNRRHWANWFDMPIPALKDMKPREAAASPEGRDLLGSLLLEYERRTDASPDNFVRPDIPALRKSLGL